MERNFTGDILNLSPLPTLKWDTYSWITSIMLTAWAGFQSRQGPYDSIDESITSDGSVKLMIHTPDDNPCTPSTEQIAAYRYLIERQEYIRDSLLQAIFAEYPTWREENEPAWDVSTEEFEEVMPRIQNPEQLKQLIGLGIVHILTIAKGGVAYVGYEFGCNWEEEHGLGAMTHAGRVVDLGHADTAFLEWVAEQDTEKGE